MLVAAAMPDPLPPHPSHAQRRAWQRFGHVLTAHELKRLVAMIRRSDPRAVVLRYSPGGRLGHLLVAAHVGGAWMPVVFDLDSRKVVTVLPDSALRAYRAELERLDPETGIPWGSTWRRHR